MIHIKILKDFKIKQGVQYIARMIAFAKAVLFGMQNKKYKKLAGFECLCNFVSF